VVVHAAEKEAAAMRVPVCIAVVDAGGELLAFSRMDAARPGSIEIAITKARSAARRRKATSAEGDGDALATIRTGLASRLNVTGLAGGIPIVVEGQTVGGVGVSAGTSAQDVAIAQAGLAALESR
jgi:uncharacterized protein GlcG (DUF336 family)